MNSYFVIEEYAPDSLHADFEFPVQLKAFHFDGTPQYLHVRELVKTWTWVWLGPLHTYFVGDYNFRYWKLGRTMLEIVYWF